MNEGERREIEVSLCRLETVQRVSRDTSATLIVNQVRKQLTGLLREDDQVRRFATIDELKRKGGQVETTNEYGSRTAIR